MDLDRRLLLGAGATLPLLVAPAAGSGPRPPEKSAPAAPPRGASGRDMGVIPDQSGDQTVAMQAAIDRAAERRIPLLLPAGRYRVGALRLRAGTHMAGEGSSPATLVFIGGERFVHAADARGITVERLALDGNGLAPIRARGLIDVERIDQLLLDRLEVRASAGHGIRLTGVAGRVSDCRIERIKGAALHAEDSLGLAILHNHIRECEDNGILVWRSRTGEDGTLVSGNRIEKVGAISGGSGQWGNGVNVFRAQGVVVTANRITDCAYSAVRANQASNVQIVANSCQRLAEVALYAEFAFEGALIANNLVDHAATGISVTNFNEGGRLAVVQGNLVRNLARREHEPVDKRGEGIAVEADTAVIGNVIEGAATVGLQIGWGRYMRECLAHGNVIRGCRVGITVTADTGAGACLITGNMIAGAREGAIRAMNQGALIGPDLHRQPTASTRVSISGNVAV